MYKNIVLYGLIFNFALASSYFARYKRYDRLRNGYNKHSPLQVNNNYYDATSYENLQFRKRFPKNVENALKNVFDENGVLFITKAKEDSDRIMNKLLNDIVKLKYEKYLREKKQKTSERLDFAETNFDMNEFDFNELVA